MTDLIDTVQLQEIGDALIELFDITLPDGTTVVRFMNGLDEGVENIYFPQKTISNSSYPLHEYVAIPIQIEGLSMASSGTLARPTLTTVNFPSLSRSHTNNLDGNSDEAVLLDILRENGIVSNRDLLNSVVVYRRTLYKYTYKSNNPNPTTAPVEFPSARFIIDRVASEDNVLVAFELANPMDIEGVKLPNRVVIGKYCPWKYQGHELDKDGGCTWPKDSKGRFYNKDNVLITDNISSIDTYNASTSYTLNTDDTPPIRVKTISNGHTQIWRLRRNTPAGRFPDSNPYYWYREDLCGKLISSCKIRFQEEDNKEFILPFGGFPGSKAFK